MSNARVNFFLLVVFGLTLPVSVVVSTNLARRSFEKVRLRDQTITVKGFAERPITSDLAKWGTAISARKPELTAAYADLEKGRARLLEYLAGHGFKKEDVWAAPVSIMQQFVRDKDGRMTNTIEFYAVRQYFTITTKDVSLVAKVASGSADLIREGIELEGESPSYLYTKLDEAKLEMIAEAVANARARAESLVKGSGSRLGPLRSASQGVFQITPAHSTDVSGSGVNDTSSVDKVIKAVVTQEYALE
ncbi:MAG: SIMPL domain-containing protein [Planctomycetes bacterium]|nr:SIMPL domain-containing protein [Planctomycetota bacterium]